MGFAFGGFTTYMPSYSHLKLGACLIYPETLRGGFFTTLVFIGGIVGKQSVVFLGINIIELLYYSFSF
ncbi:MAG: hypothetical protein Ct9H300mP2_5040 [Candidatus Neomarinimicrobiota bacterium]|nr:MAG: hypothetical protein Ct9H300mP2_5040 [Candidatus Neomarinimicrobiota bacterium]